MGLKTIHMSKYSSLFSWYSYLFYFRLFAVQEAFERGYTVEEVFIAMKPFNIELSVKSLILISIAICVQVSRISKIDRWFLSKLHNIALAKADLSRTR